MVVTYTLKIKDKELTIPVKKLTNIFSHMQGLMFQKSSPNLLFIFKKPKKIAIHSYFCKPFIGIWLLNDEIVQIKIVEPNTFSVKSKEKFDKLLEVPNNTPEFKKILEFVDETKKV